MIYIAAPYTHASAIIRAERAGKAAQAMFALGREGINSISPTFLGHALEEKFRTNLPYEFWLEWSRALLVKCHEVYVLPLPGWRESRGVAEECRYAAALKLPITGYSIAGCEEHVSGRDIRKQFDLPISRATALRAVGEKPE